MLPHRSTTRHQLHRTIPEAAAAGPITREAAITVHTLRRPPGTTEDTAAKPCLTEAIRAASPAALAASWRASLLPDEPVVHPMLCAPSQRLFRLTAYNQKVINPRIKRVAEANFPTRWGQFRIYGFEGEFGANGRAQSGKEEAIALVMGDIHSTAPLVRIHSQCLTGDVFASLRCDCRQQLELALGMIANAGVGILIYEQQEGRGIGLMAKIQAYELQDRGLDTIEANEKLGFDSDYRQYLLPAEMLKQLGVSAVKLISNNPDKVAALQNAGIEVVERVSAEVEPYEHAEKYLQTKKKRMGHLFSSF
jgi:GTP cyclohydrolase II